MSTPLNECSELLPETEPEPNSESKPEPTVQSCLDQVDPESKSSSEILEKIEIDTIIKESVSVNPNSDLLPSTSSSTIAQVTTLIQVTHSTVTEDTCDNLPSDDDEDEYDEFDEFKDKRKRQSLAERLPSNSFYKLAPRVFIFPGAEVYMDDEDDEDSASCADENDTIITPEEVAEIENVPPPPPVSSSSSDSSTTDHQGRSSI